MRHIRNRLISTLSTAVQPQSSVMASQMVSPGAVPASRDTLFMRGFSNRQSIEDVRYDTIQAIDTFLMH